VQRSVWDEFMTRFEQAVKGVVVADPRDESTEMGPLISAGQRDRVASYVPDDTNVAFRGTAPEGPGFWFPPTVVTPSDPADRVLREEVFGPVVAVVPFEDEADAIRIANETPYGLAAAVWTRDIFKAFRVVKALEAGIVWVNHMQPTFVEAPWGGYKASGFGRELGHWGVEEYLETKQVFINLDEKPIGWY
jgi:acyl-CoA reductase-like NAD-dependent aldehyde dehydrogenase